MAAAVVTAAVHAPGRVAAEAISLSRAAVTSPVRMVVHVRNRARINVVQSRRPHVRKHSAQMRRREHPSLGPMVSPCHKLRARVVVAVAVVVAAAVVVAVRTARRSMAVSPDLMGSSMMAARMKMLLAAKCPRAMAR